MKGERDKDQKSMACPYKIGPCWCQWPEALGMESSSGGNTEVSRAAEQWLSRMSKAMDSMMQELEMLAIIQIMYKNQKKLDNLLIKCGSSEH